MLIFVGVCITSSNSSYRTKQQATPTFCYAFHIILWTITFLLYCQYMFRVLEIVSLLRFYYHIRNLVKKQFQESLYVTFLEIVLLDKLVCGKNISSLKQYTEYTKQAVRNGRMLSTCMLGGRTACPRNKADAFPCHRSGEPAIVLRGWSRKE